MENVFEALRVLESIAERILRGGNIEVVRTVRTIMVLIRTAVRLTIAWPFVLLLAAMLGYGFAQYAVPIITILILLAFLWMATRLESLAILTAEAAFSPNIPLLGKFVEKAREVTNALRIVFGLELLTGIYFSVVPIANDRRLALILVLVVAAAACFVGIKNWKPIVVVLGVVFCVITLIFYLGGRNNIHLDKVFEAHHASSDGINSAPSVSTSPLQPSINQVCDDALDGPAPVATTHESLTDNIPQGCFGSDTRIDWQSWCYQPYPRNPIAPGWQVTFQFLDGDGRVWATKGPYGPMDKPSFQYFPGRFRLQGSGIIRFYPGNCT